MSERPPRLPSFKRYSNLRKLIDYLNEEIGDANSRTED